MLEEIIGFALSCCSLFANEISRVSSCPETSSENAGCEFEDIDNNEQKPFINKEYVDLDLEDHHSNVTNYNIYQNNRKCWKSFRNSLWINLNITFITIIYAAFAIILVYVEMNTTYSCLEWGSHNNTLP